MKKAFVILFSFVVVFSLSSCSILRNRISNSIKTIKSAAAEFSLSPEWTEESADNTVSPENTDEPRSTESDVPESTEAPEATSEPQATISTDEGFTVWPKDLPYNIPEFTYGSIQKDQSFKAESDGAATYSMQFTGVKISDVEAYGKAMKDAGMTVNTAEDSGTYSAVGMIQKDLVPVVMLSAYLSKESGSCSVVLILNTEENKGD